MAKKKRSLMGRLLRLALAAAGAFVALSVLWVLVLKWVPVAVTPLMIQQKHEFRHEKGFKIRYDWVSLDEISPELVKAVVTTEDNLYFKHHGFSWDAIKKASEANRKKGKIVRGGSTISQQTAKNVFLPPSRTMTRKAFEAYFTVLIEGIWGKERIMEVYLNVIEFGKGVFGAEAAAQYHFGKSASKLTRIQACRLAVVLPNPKKMNAGRPSNYVSNRAANISRRLGQVAYPEWVTKRKKNKTAGKDK